MACKSCSSSGSSGGSNTNINNICVSCGGSSGGSGNGSTTGSGSGDPPTWFGGGGHGSGGNNGGPTGGGTTGGGTGTGDDSSGSGDGGAPADGDKLHTPPTCLKLTTISHDFCSDGFEFAMLDIRSAIEDACTMGGWDSTTQKLVSVKLDTEGLAYLSAISLLGDTLISTNGRKLTIKDAEGEVHNLDYRQDIMQAPLPLSPQFIMRKYDAYGVDIPMGDSGNPIYLDGQMAAPARWLWPCSDPKAARDPAWLYMCVASFVTNTVGEVAFDFARWEGLTNKTSNEVYDIHHFATFELNNTHEEWHLHLGGSGVSDYPNDIQPVNDSSNYGHYWVIIHGQKPIKPGKTHLHIGGKYATVTPGVIVQMQLFEQASADVGGTYYARGDVMEVDFAATDGVHVADYAFDGDLTAPTVGLGLWYIAVQINSYQIGIMDIKGVFS